VLGSLTADARAANPSAIDVGRAGSFAVRDHRDERRNVGDRRRDAHGRRLCSGHAGARRDADAHGQGDPNAVFILQAESTLSTAAGSEVSLVGGAQSRSTGVCSRATVP